MRLIFKFISSFILALVIYANQLILPIYEFGGKPLFVDGTAYANTSSTVSNSYHSDAGSTSLPFCPPNATPDGSCVQVSENGSSNFFYGIVADDLKHGEKAGQANLSVFIVSMTLLLLLLTTAAICLPALITWSGLFMSALGLSWFIIEIVFQQLLKSHLNSVKDEINKLKGNFTLQGNYNNIQIAKDTAQVSVDQYNSLGFMKKALNDAKAIYEKKKIAYYVLFGVSFVTFGIIASELILKYFTFGGAGAAFLDQPSCPAFAQKHSILIGSVIAAACVGIFMGGAAGMDIFGKNSINNQKNISLSNTNTSKNQESDQEKLISFFKTKIIELTSNSISTNQKIYDLLSDQFLGRVYANIAGSPTATAAINHTPTNTNKGNNYALQSGLSMGLTIPIVCIVLAIISFVSTTYGSLLILPETRIVIATMIPIILGISAFHLLPNITKNISTRINVINGIMKYLEENRKFTVSPLTNIESANQIKEYDIFTTDSGPLSDASLKKNDEVQEMVKKFNELNKTNLRTSSINFQNSGTMVEALSQEDLNQLINGMKNGTLSGVYGVYQKGQQMMVARKNLMKKIEDLEKKTGKKILDFPAAQRKGIEFIKNLQSQALKGIGNVKPEYQKDLKIPGGDLIGGENGEKDSLKDQKDNAQSSTLKNEGPAPASVVGNSRAQEMKEVPEENVDSLKESLIKNQNSGADENIETSKALQQYDISGKDINKDPSRSLWDIVTTRYKKSAFSQLLIKKRNIAGSKK